MNDTKDAAKITRIVREMTKKPRSWRSTAAYALAHAPCGIPSKHAETMRSSPPLRALLEAVAAGCDVAPPEIAEAAVAASEGRERPSWQEMSVQQQISETCRGLLALHPRPHPEAALRAHRLLWLDLVYASPLRGVAQAMRLDPALRAFLEDVADGRDPRDAIGYEAAVRAAEGRETPTA
jgi:predicted transcriptional regulator